MNFPHSIGFLTTLLVTWRHRLQTPAHKTTSLRWGHRSHPASTRLTISPSNSGNRFDHRSDCSSSGAVSDSVSLSSCSTAKALIIPDREGHLRLARLPLRSDIAGFIAWIDRSMYRRKDGEREIGDGSISLSAAACC